MDAISAAVFLQRSVCPSPSSIWNLGATGGWDSPSFGASPEKKRTFSIHVFSCAQGFASTNPSSNLPLVVVLTAVGWQHKVCTMLTSHPARSKELTSVRGSGAEGRYFVWLGASGKYLMLAEMDVLSPTSTAVGTWKDPRETAVLPFLLLSRKNC